MSIFMNPMILMGLVSMVVFIGLPKLVENSTYPFDSKELTTRIERKLTNSAVDPETKAEWEAAQKENPMSSILGGASGGQQQANPLGNFDMAAYLAGSNKKESGGGSGSGSSSPAPAEPKAKNQGVRR